MERDAPPLPVEDDTARCDGIKFHALAADMLLGKLWNESDYDSEMIEAAEAYVDDVGNITPGPDAGVETRVNTGFVESETHGFVDAWCYDADAATLTVWDAKYGHRPVEVYQNPQLLIYARAIWNTLGQARVETIRLRIVQPRSFHPDGIIRGWSFPADDLGGHLHPILSAAEDARSRPDCTPGPHCITCAGRHVCKSAQTVSYIALDRMESAPAIHTLTGPDLALEVRKMRELSATIKARLDGLEAQATAEVRRGVTLPGLALRESVSALKWSGVEPDALFAMGDALGVELRKPAQPITPTQAKKAGLDETVISAYARRESTGFKLVDDDGSMVRRIFGGK
jgi:hypothetical protein